MGWDVGHCKDHEGNEVMIETSSGMVIVSVNGKQVLRLDPEEADILYGYLDMAIDDFLSKDDRLA